jgi:hypothetical protein
MFINYHEEININSVNYLIKEEIGISYCRITGIVLISVV